MVPVPHKIRATIYCISYRSWQQIILRSLHRVTPLSFVHISPLLQQDPVNPDHPFLTSYINIPHRRSHTHNATNSDLHATCTSRTALPCKQDLHLTTIISNIRRAGHIVQARLRISPYKDKVPREAFHLVITTRSTRRRGSSIDAHFESDAVFPVPAPEHAAGCSPLVCGESRVRCFDDPAL